MRGDTGRSEMNSDAVRMGRGVGEWRHTVPNCCCFHRVSHLLLQDLSPSLAASGQSQGCTCDLEREARREERRGRERERREKEEKGRREERKGTERGERDKRGREIREEERGTERGEGERNKSVFVASVVCVEK